MQLRPFRNPSNTDLQVRSAAGTQVAKVIDFHANGARLVGEFRVQRGEMITAEIRGNKIPAQVRWVGRSRIGIAFRPPLSAHLLALLETRTGRHTPPKRFDSTQLREM